MFYQFAKIHQNKIRKEAFPSWNTQPSTPPAADLSRQVPPCQCSQTDRVEAQQPIACQDQRTTAVRQVEVGDAGTLVLQSFVQEIQINLGYSKNPTKVEDCEQKTIK